MTRRRALLAIALAGFASFAGWRVIATHMADMLAASDPERALQWDSRHPGAWLALAERRLQEKNYQRAITSARRQLAIDPAHGKAFAVLATASEERDSVTRANLYRIAARRAPRDLRVHGWQADQALQAGQPAQMLAEVDVILRLAPQMGTELLPILAQLAADPAFADALVEILRTNPPWGSTLLAVLSSKGLPGTKDRVFGHLRARGALDQEETRRWLDSMLSEDRWDAAYAHWAGIALASGDKRLRAVHNGGFEQQLTNLGFDWRLASTPGVYTETAPIEGASGNWAAHIHFLGRPVARADLEQPLLLSPGPYRMTFRAKAKDLRSEQGLRWTLTCVGQAQDLVKGPEINGDFEWKSLSMTFQVPVNCPGQWLRLSNPAPEGSSQMVVGDLWLDDVSVVAIAAPAR